MQDLEPGPGQMSPEGVKVSLIVVDQKDYVSLQCRYPVYIVVECGLEVYCSAPRSSRSFPRTTPEFCSGPAVEEALGILGPHIGTKKRGKCEHINDPRDLAPKRSCSSG